MVASSPMLRPAPASTRRVRLFISSFSWLIMSFALASCDTDPCLDTVLHSWELLAGSCCRTINYFHVCDWQNFIMRWIREVDNELPETRLTAQAWDKLGLDNRHKAAVCVISVLYTTSCFRAAGGYHCSAAFD